MDPGVRPAHPALGAARLRGARVGAVHVVPDRRRGHCARLRRVGRRGERPGARPGNLAARAGFGRVARRIGRLAADPSGMEVGVPADQLPLPDRVKGFRCLSQRECNENPSLDAPRRTSLETFGGMAARMARMASYTGEVEAGGPAAVRELPGLRITKVAVGPMDNNAYFLRCTRTGDTVLIDAAAEPDRLLELREDGLLISVITTHRHADHWQALESVVGVTGPNVIAHPDDAGGLPIPVTETVEDGD